MKKAVTAVTLFDMMFLFVLSLSGTLGGTVGTVLYYIAFLLPLFCAIPLLRGTDEVKTALPKILPDKKSLRYTLPVTAPFVLLVFVISFLTSFLLGLLGFTDSTDVSGNIFLVILKHALLPAIFEEALFRFVPIALIAPYSKKNAVLISAVFFACIHCSLFQIPYALAAGLILSAISVISGSIFPAVLLHFINNLLSIFFMRCGESAAFNIAFFASIGALTLASVIFILVTRKAYKNDLKAIFEDKCKLEFTASSILFIAMTLLIGIINLWVSI